MEQYEYTKMALHQSEHWWYRGRRLIISSFLDRLKFDLDPKILEVGCGVGGNIGLLKKYGELSAFEMNEKARAMAEEYGGIEVQSGCLPNDIPYNDKKFDLICMFDVLEHVEEDMLSLKELKGSLSKGGRILLTVPSYNWLYGKHDTELHHFRRYSSKELKFCIEKAGLHTEYMSYFNTFLFPLAVVARCVDFIRPSSVSLGSKTPSNCINKIFLCALRIENFFLKKLKLPCGLSIIAIVSEK
jgi:SAM-dependent methyltransferase